MSEKLNKILVVDDVMAALLDQNPDDKKALQEDFELVPHRALSKHDNVFVKENGRFVLLKDSHNIKPNARAQYLVKSKLHDDLFVDVKTYEQQYWQDYIDFVIGFCSKTGAKKYGVFYSDEKRSSFIDETDSSAKFDVAGVKAGSSSQDIQEQSKKYKGVTFIKVYSREPAWKIDEVKRWLEQNRINVEALPSEMKTSVESFLRNGEIKKNWKVDISGKQALTEVRNYNKECGVEISGGKINKFTDSLKKIEALNINFKGTLHSKEEGEVEKTEIAEIFVYAEWIDKSDKH